MYQFSLLLCALLLWTPLFADENASTETSAPSHAILMGEDIANEKCLKCHADPDDKTYEMDNGKVVDIYVDEAKFTDSVHGQQRCTGCHTNVKERMHDEGLPVAVSCVQCHQKNWEAQQNNPDPQFKRLGVVMEQIDSYMHSVHARASAADQSKTNATCHDCHDAHYIGTLGSEARADHRLKNPEVCGRCHEPQKTAYLTSVHGQAIAQQNSDAAVCSDCHTPHNIAPPENDPTKMLITQNCGNCHTEARKSYMASYHGQVNRLGYANTAKCFDCHGSHDIQKTDDPTSKVHADNRLETCQTCHENAPDGFLGYHPHGTTDNFDKYPEMWITAKFMNMLIIGVFAFFWTHVILWFYREFRDRQEGKSISSPSTEQVYFRRFSSVWRTLHLLFAMTTMFLVMTGTTLLFSHTQWASIIMALLGGPQVEAIIHRSVAMVWFIVFLAHLGLVVSNIYRNRKQFRWFGPTSLLPNWQDMRDVVAMFRWFFGKAPRPNFDRWSYWQKFDYWAPFWGVSVIGFSGLALTFPNQIAHYLPGWVFNVATIVHAEEALLAAMFIFTVHFFNAHFRPDKFPMNITMFTGAVPLEDFKHDHRLEYERLEASGELERYLVRKPSPEMVMGSKFLAAFLIFWGLSLLTLVLFGYITMH